MEYGRKLVTEDRLGRGICGAKGGNEESVLKGLVCTYYQRITVMESMKKKEFGE